MTFIKDIKWWWKSSGEAKAFLLYVGFLTIFSIVTFETKPGSIQYYMNTYVKSHFATEEFEGISDYASLFAYLEGEFLDKMYLTKDFSGNNLDKVQRSFIMGEGRLLGNIRLRQLRGKSMECPIPDFLKEVAKNPVTGLPIYYDCLEKLRDQNTTTYGNFTALEDFLRPYLYQSRKELNSIAFPEAGTFDTYGQDGFVLDLVPNVAPSQLAQELQNCYGLMNYSTYSQCMPAQGFVSYDMPQAPPPAPAPPPPPPAEESASILLPGLKFALFNADYANTTRAEIDYSVELNSVNDTGEFIFEIRNTGLTMIDWRLRSANRTDWVDNVSPSMGTLISSFATQISITFSRPAGTDATEAATYANLTSGNVTYPVGTESFVFEMVQDTTVTLKVNINMSYFYDAGSGRRRRSLQNIFVAQPELICTIPPIPQPVGLDTSLCHVHQFEYWYNLRCTAGVGLRVAENLNSGQQGPSGCCRLKYASYQQIYNLMQPDKCGQCSCRSDQDDACVASCSAKALAQTQLATLRSQDYFDRYTRAYIVDFTFLFGSRNLLTSVRLMFETPNFGSLTGGVFPKIRTRTYRLYRYVTTRQKLIGVLEIVLMVLVGYYTLSEFYEMYRIGWGYWKNWWNYIDWANLIILYVVFAIRLTMIARVDNFDYDSSSFEYIDFPPMAYYTAQELNVSALNFFLIYFKVFKFLSKLPRMDAVFKTIGAASFDLFLFMSMTMVIFFGFAAAFYTCFGTELQAWKTLGDSTGSLMRILLGDFDYPELQESNKIMAPILFYLFIFVSFFVLLNMFIAIICDSYADVKSQQDEADLYFYRDLMNTIQLKLKSLLYRKQKIHDLTEGLAAADKDADNKIDEDELRELLKHNPEALKILEATGVKELLAKYDVDNDGTLDKSELIKVLEDLAMKEKEALRDYELEKNSSKQTHDDVDHHTRARVRRIGSDVGGSAGDVAKLEEQMKDMSRNMAKKLSLMVDLIMSLSDQVSATVSRGGRHGGHSLTRGEPLPPPNPPPRSTQIMPSNNN